MKRLYSLISALLLCGTIMAGNVLGTATSGTTYYGTGDPWYTAVGLSDGSVAITAVHLSSAATEITIPSVLYTNTQSGSDYLYYNVTQVGNGSVLWVDLSGSNVALSAIKTLTLEEGITTISSSLFTDWSTTTTVLETLNLPSTLTTIYSAAFYWCDNLTTINCDAATAPTLAEASSGWTDHFKGNSSWDVIGTNCTVNVPDNVAKCSYNTASWSYWTVFYNAGNVVNSSVVIESATAGNEYSGSNCKFIGLADGTVAITSYYFSDASETSVAFPTTVEATYDITGSADISCPKNFAVSQIGYSDGSAWNFWFDLDGSGAATQVTSMIIPEGVTTVAGYFSGTTALETLVLPSTLTAIHDYAFSGCTGLTSITSNAVNPPALDGLTTFAWSVVTSADLVVPAGA